MQQGKVYIVGAGPGDYRLISVKASEYIQQADVIIYDRLVDSRLLGQARPDAEAIYVGKASNQHTLCQEEINQLLTKKAQEHKKVLRLKGGDPFVFGRGGEEALHLKAEGIPFEIVSGITSAVAAPAYAGIPVTHRGVAASFAVITGHEDPDKPGGTVRWEQLATGADTLVILMGVENIASIAGKLMRYGRPGSTPTAAIRWGTKPEQTVLVTTLENAVADVAAKGIEPPAVLVVGDVVNLRAQLSWFDQRPLFGRRILVTRAREQAGRLTAKLEALGAQCVEAPAIRIASLEDYQQADQAISTLAEFHWLIFTSVNGVQAFFDRLFALGKDVRAIGAIHIAAIGVQTARHLRKFGINADVVPVEFRAEGLVDALQDVIQPGMSVLIPRAETARDALPEGLKALGAHVQVIPIYKTVLPDGDGGFVRTVLSAAPAIDMVTFTSSSTVVNLLRQLGERGPQLLAGKKVACIGPITAAACLDNGIRPDIVADEYTIDGLAAAIEKFYKEELQ